MTYKTLLLQCDGDKTVGRRVEIAAELAKRFGSHLIGLHVRAPFEPPMIDETGFEMAPFFEAYEEAAQADRDAASAAFAGATNRKDISSEWRTVDGLVDEEIVAQARYADLTVVGQANPDASSSVSPPPNLPEVVALSSGRPVLVIPYVGAPRQPGGNILLCWNASRESARAAAEALPFLKQAKDVVVLIIDGKTSRAGRGAEPGADIATWLGRHGVNVTVKRETAADVDVGDVILSRAADLDTDLIVIGLYGHSRAREFILGGASRTLLANMTAPLFIAQ